MATRVFSGIQPTGTMHIGNYFGAIRNWIALQDTLPSIYCIVNYHALTGEVDPTTLAAASRSMAIDLLACGIDPERSILFVQSDVPEHTELAWILGCVTGFGDLSRMTQFKEKSEHRDFVPVGLFTYPVLQSADILLYHADGVPVGEDQVQHIELCRRIARRFNARFGDYFPEPEPLLLEKGARIMSLADPTQKMSKSAGESHYVGVFEPEASIRKKIRSAVTDVGPTAEGGMSPGVANLFDLVEIAAEPALVAELRAAFGSGTLMYSKLKDAAFESLMRVLGPIHARRAEIAASGTIDEVLAEGAERARAIARKTIAEVRKKVGIG